MEVETISIELLNSDQEARKRSSVLSSLQAKVLCWEYL